MQSFSYHSRLSNSCICCIDLKLKRKLSINLSKWNLCCDNVARKRNTWRYNIAWSTCMFSFNCVTVSKGRLFLPVKFQFLYHNSDISTFIFFTIYKPVKFHQIFVWLINCSPTLVTSYKSFIFSLKGEQNNRYTSNKYTNTKPRLILKYIYVHTNLYLAINIGIDVKQRFV